MTNRQVCKHQTIQLWGRIIWENICFKINSKALYRILESKEKDIEFIEDKSWQDIMMKYFRFIPKEKRKEKSLWRFPAFLLFPPKAICDIAIENVLWICTVILAVLYIECTSIMQSHRSISHSLTTFITHTTASWNTQQWAVEGNCPLKTPAAFKLQQWKYYLSKMYCHSSS